MEVPPRMSIRRPIPITSLLLILGVLLAAPVCAGEETAAEEPAPAKDESAPTKDEAATAPSVESHEILARQPITEQAAVVHVLIGWADLAEAYGGRLHERAKQRSAAEALTLAASVLARARAGEDFKALMRAHSEDWGSADSGKSYPVTTDARLVAPFKALSLRLEVDEVGAVESRYGWHIIKRIQ